MIIIFITMFFILNYVFFIMRLSAVFVALAAGFSGVTHAQTEVTTSDQNDSKEIEKIEVVGRAFSLYRPTESGFATRTNTSLEKIPQSIPPPQTAGYEFIAYAV